MVEAFRRLPGVGRKSAERMAFGVLGMSDSEISEFLTAISEGKSSIRPCSCCGNISASELCPICEDDTRDKKIICVVEDSKAVLTFEKIKEFRGVYHVLGGVINPRAGIGPDDINISTIIDRIRENGAEEVMISTNATVEGEATAMYISRLLRPMEIKVTRLAYGVPVGSQLEYADEVTLSRALEGRQLI